MPRFRSLLIAAMAAAVALIGAPAAVAHVTAQPGTAEKGGYGAIAFRVPNESETAGTVKVQVTLPLEHPVPSVRTKPVPGWNAHVETVALERPRQSGNTEITEAVRTITWTARPGVRIGPGEYMDFEVSAGPLPENTDRLVMPVVQTYDDGTVVRWDDPPVPEGASEPEHPAPVLELRATEQDRAPSATTGSGENGGSETDETARWLGGAGLVVGALALGVGIGAVLRSRGRGAG